MVGMNLERGEKKGREDCRDHVCFFSLVQSAGVVWRRGLQLRRDLGGRGGWLMTLFLWLVCLIVRVFDR